MSNETAIVVKTTSAIAAYGDREDVREITDRLMHLHPAAKEVGAPAMRAVAQLALMRGANPLPTAGEIYVWPDNKGTVVMDIGIAYYRRIASKKDRVLWEIEPRLMTDEERDRYRIADGDIGAICKGAMLSQAKELMDLGVSLKEAREASARTSTAIVEYGDQFYTYDSKYSKKGDQRQAPHGRTWEWVAEKRAEKAFYKMMSMVDDTLTERIDAVNEVREQVGKAYQLYEERQNYTLEDANRDFFDIEPAGPDWDGMEEHDMVIIDAEPDDDELPWEDEEEPAGADGGLSADHFSCDNWADFCRLYAAGHPYYRNQHHVFGNVKKILGNKVKPIGEVDLPDVIQQLEAHAKAEADKALDEEE